MMKAFILSRIRATRYGLTFNKNFILRIVVLWMLHAVGWQLHAQEFIHLETGTYPSMAADHHGGVYVTWENGNKPVPVLHYDSKGVFLPNDTATFRYGFASRRPHLAIGASYSVVVWNEHLSEYIDYLKTYIIGAVFNTSDPHKNTVYMVNDNPLNNLYRNNPNVEFLNDTLLIAVWDESLGGKWYIVGQLFSVYGNWFGPNFLISDHDRTTTTAVLPRIAAKQGGGRFTVLWVDNSSGTYNLYGRKYALDGSPQGSSFLISDDPQMTSMYYYGVAVDTAGNFCVVWNADKGKKSQMEWRWFLKDGTPSTNVEPLTSLDTLLSAGSCVDVSIDEKNRAVLVWEQFGSASPIESRIYGRCYSADTHLPLGDAFKISSNTVGRYDIYPNVIATGGQIFVIWQNDSSGIRGRAIKIDEVTSVTDDRASYAPAGTYTLYPNYPNPFNPSTTISFSIPSRSHVSLKIYDVMGREVATIVSENMSARIYQRQWNASGMPSGVYFYRLQAGAYTETKRLVLMK